jgi:hypothetical protein
VVSHCSHLGCGIFNGRTGDSLWGIKWGNSMPLAVGELGAEHPQVEEPMLENSTCSGRRGRTQLYKWDGRVALPTLRRSCKEEDSYGRLTGARGFRIQTLQTAGAKGATGKMKSSAMSRIYYRQLGLLGRAVHEAALVCLGADERTIELEHHSPVSTPRSSR